MGVTLLHEGAPSTKAASDAVVEAADTLQLNAARIRAQLSHDELWIGYFAFTGQAGPLEVEAYLSGLMPLDSHQHDVLVCVVNELLDDGPSDQACRVAFPGVTRLRLAVGM